MSGLGGITWLAGQHATLEEAVAVGGDVRAAAVAAGASLPKKDLSRLYPATMQDAVSIVHARLEENKKKAQQSKQKSKSKGAPHSPSDSHFPGARQGGGDPSAFWMYIEVRAIACTAVTPTESPLAAVVWVHAVQRPEWRPCAAAAVAWALAGNRRHRRTALRPHRLMCLPACLCACLPASLPAGLLPGLHPGRPA